MAQALRAAGLRPEDIDYVIESIVPLVAKLRAQSPVGAGRP